MNRTRLSCYALIGMLAVLVLPVVSPAFADDPAPGAGPGAAPSAAAPQSGYLIGSFAIGRGDYPMGAKKFHYNTYEFKYRQLDPDRKPAKGFLKSLDRALGDEPSATRSDEVHGAVGSHGKFLTNKHPEDFTWEEGSGTVFAVPLPEGRYEFYQYFLHQNSGNIQATWEAEAEFSIPFEIHAGRATYVGEIRAVNLFAKNMFGIKLADGAEWQIHDSLQRDEPLLRARFPELANVPVDAVLITEGLRQLGGPGTP